MTRLRRVTGADLTIERRRQGRGYAYFNADGRQVKDAATRERARHLAIPPAWKDVRIAPLANAHIQASGFDSAGRLQYIYHPEWETRRTKRKQRHLMALAAALPRLRRHVREDLKKDAGSRDLALAIGVALIDRTAMRVGRERYLDTAGTRGAGTLYSRDVTVKGDEVRLDFLAKNSKQASYRIIDAALASAIERIKTIRGRRLLMYLNDEGKPRPIRTEQLNAYLRDVAGVPVSAKDFRTLHASALAAEALAKLEPGASATARKRQANEVVKKVATFLQNTPAICRKSYVAPCLFELFDRQKLSEIWAASSEGISGLRLREARLSAILEAMR